MLLNEYETVVIIRPDLDDATTYSLVEKFEQVISGNEGHILIRDDWGKRKLAYPVNKHQKGHYILISHLAPARLIAELERRIRNEDSVLRFLSTRISDSVDVPVRLEKAAEQRRIKEEQERLRRERGEFEAAEEEEVDEEAEEQDD